MGCFSYVCQACGESIQSNSYTGDHCKLFLLKDGCVIEKMSGRYNSYGRVFSENSEHSLEWESMDWMDIVDLEFDGNDRNGIAAFHSRCWDGIDPEFQSDSDPDQGWGDCDNPREFYDEY